MSPGFLPQNCPCEAQPWDLKTSENFGMCLEQVLVFAMWPQEFGSQLPTSEELFMLQQNKLTMKPKEINQLSHEISTVEVWAFGV